MRKFMAALMLFSVMSTSSVFAEEENVQNVQTHTYSFYVVSHSPASNDYWAVTQDGLKSLWLRESDVTGESLKENDTFKATFDDNGKLLSVEKYSFH